MMFDLSSEQQLFRKTLGAWLKQNYSFSRRQAIANSDMGMSPEVWAELASLGVLGAGAAAPEKPDSGGHVEVMIVMEAIGRALLIEPVMETAIIATTLLELCGGQEALLHEVAVGKVRPVLAWAEGSGGERIGQVSTMARREGEGWVINGEKSLTVAAPWSDMLLLVSRTEGRVGDLGGVSLFRVDPAASGVGRREFRTIDGRRAADVSFSGLQVGPEALLGTQGQARAVLDHTRDTAIAAGCAEALGIMRRLVQDTFDYISQRHQFGRALSESQALQHRVSAMYLSCEKTHSAVLLATIGLARPAEQRSLAVSAAKTAVSRAARSLAEEAIQLHGGVGMTDDMPIGHGLRRLLAIECEFGSTASHQRAFMDARRAGVGLQ